MEIVNWAGYQFLVYKPEDAHRALMGGIYVFAKLTSDWIGNRTWQALYVGQAMYFSTRLPGHERWAEAVNLGANQIHLMVENNPFQRKQIEDYLIVNLHPPLNVIHK